MLAPGREFFLAKFVQIPLTFTERKQTQEIFPSSSNKFQKSSK